MALLNHSGADTDVIHTIGLTYRPIRKNILNYRLLWENRESDVFLQMSYIPREFTRTTAAATMHLLQKWGIDSFSIRAGNYVPPKPLKNGGQESLPKPEVLRRTKRFDPEPLAFRGFRAWIDRGDMLNCSCPVCEGKAVDEFISTYNSESESYPCQIFNAANRLHEYYCSSDEFERSRDYIRTGELSEYFETKEGLSRSDVDAPPSLDAWIP